MDALSILTAYICTINLVAFALMGIDKLRAKKRLWRIPEATLFLFVLFGGSIGGILGMLLFRHKTRHWYFLYGFPFILIVQLAVIYLLWRSPIQFQVM